MKIILQDLPKISLNEFYSGMHWTKRKQIKDDYHWLIRSKIKSKIDYPCHVEYHFEFRIRPHDCSNNSAMIKLIEDVIFKDDSPKTVKSIKTSSKKGERDKVTIIINKDC